MKTALISVFNKEGIAEFAKQLKDLGFNILASGGTAKELSSAGIEVTDAASLVGGGAILGHRVVTLSREIHAGLLARDIKEDREELERLKIPWIDLVCVDLYPLELEIENWKLEIGGYDHSDKAKDAVIEKTDIGGPTMIRSAAKGRRIVVCDPSDRMPVIEWLKNGEPDRENFISRLVAKSEAVVADYCLYSARFHGEGEWEGVVGKKIYTCKYGENGYQTPAGLYQASGSDELALPKFTVVAGTTPSYNNWCDVDRLLQTITHIAAGFDANKGNLSVAEATSPLKRGEGSVPAPMVAVGGKHGNPCGAAVGDNPSEVLKKMLEGDLRAIFGGLVMTNFPIDELLAEILLSHKMETGRRLLDGIIAPSFTEGAIETLKRKGDKCRFIVNPALEKLNKNSLDSHTRIRYVRGGFLAQPNYLFTLNFSAPEMAKSGKITDKQEMDMLLAWAVGSTSNSNTVTIVKDQMLIGNGVGQQDRVGGCELAIKRAKDAGHSVQGAAAYSDSFFPFTDGPEVLAKAGIKSILATSGSVRDKDVKEFCQKSGVALYLVPDSQARGFFGH
ncbi:MAG: hypothetical protein M1383_00535 [Patescibacteria group bacterium]|nr:hypothetical protein [Patescibacteria group bacterium]